MDSQKPPMLFPQGLTSKGTFDISLPTLQRPLLPSLAVDLSRSFHSVRSPYPLHHEEEHERVITTLLCHYLAFTPSLSSRLDETPTPGCGLSNLPAQAFSGCSKHIPNSRPLLTQVSMHRLLL